MSSPPAAPARLAAIDMTKGIAILGVILIHAGPLGDSFLFRHLVSHAVPIFVVLFGLNSELWWQRRAFPTDLGLWYRGRARRILVPMWAVLPVWWALALYFQPRGVPLGAPLAARHALGYLAFVGTGWFITMILQLVLVFPVLHALARRRGPWLVLAGGFACTIGVLVVRSWLSATCGRFGYLAFAPRFFAHVAFGLALAPHVARLGAGAAAAALALLVPGALIADGGLVPTLAPYGRQLLDLSLVVLLLVVMDRLHAIPGLARALSWLGASSYGIYLGQMLVHNAFVFALGLRGVSALDPWLYAAILFGGALVFVALGEALLRLAGALSRSGVPLPDLSR